MRDAEGVQSQVEFEDVHSRFPEQTQVSLIRVLLYQIAHRGFGQGSLPSDAGNLKLGRGRRNFGVQARRRGRDEIHWNKLGGVLLMQAAGIGANAVNQFLIGGSVVSAAGVGGGVSVARRRGT